MIDERDLVEEAVTALVKEEPSFEGLLRRRDHRQRNQRIAAGVVAVCIIAALVGAAALGYERSPAPKPVGLGPPTAFRQAGEVLEHAANGALEAVDPKTGESRVLIDSETGEAAWSPDGTRLAYIVPCETDTTRVVNPISPCLRPSSQGAGMWLKNASGPPFELVSWYGTDAWAYGDFAWSPDGSHIAYRTAGSDGGVYVANADGTDRTQVGGTGDGSLADVPPSWSPDGTRIAYSISSSDGNNDVYVATLGQGDPQRIVAGKDPVWSPDGSHIAFVADGGISVVNDDGSDLTAAGPEGYEFAWSPDGSRIVYHVERRDKASDPFHEELWVVAPDGSDRVNILPAGCCPHGIVDQGFAWSPDGSRITFVDGAADGAAEWTLTRSDGGDADVPLSDHDLIDLTRWLSWQPCLCTVGPYA